MRRFSHLWGWKAAAFEQAPHGGRHYGLFPFELRVREPKNVEAESAKREIAAAIVLEGNAAAVIGIAVGFDDHPALSPEEVDPQFVDLDIDLRRREAMATADTQEEELKVAPGSLGSRARAKR